MPRADLHYAAAVDGEIYEASQVDPSLLDPVVRVESALPGTARPFVVVRVYQGPQGAYTEWFKLLGPDGGELARSPLRRIVLEGEMFEDRFATTLTDVEVNRPGEHELVFFVNDDEVGRVPVFVQAGVGGDPKVAAEETFKAATKKGDILWVSVPTVATGRRQKAGTHTQPVWFHGEGGLIYVLNGPGEQHVQGLDDAQQVDVTARSKDLRSRVAKVPATVRVLDNDGDEFAKIAEKMLSGRLNLPDGDAALDRWRRECRIVELTPMFSHERATVSA